MDSKYNDSFDKDFADLLGTEPETVNIEKPYNSENDLSILEGIRPQKTFSDLGDYYESTACPLDELQSDDMDLVDSGSYNQSPLKPFSTYPTIPLSYQAKLKGLRSLSSKYDFVKVKVFLNDSQSYVLSRFLLHRVLMATLVKDRDAIKIALDLKKELVDSGRLSITQQELEEELFSVLSKYGYGSDSPIPTRYRLLSSFEIKKQSIVILLESIFDNLLNHSSISRLALHLSERMNIGVVLDTSLVMDLLGCVNHFYKNETLDYRSQNVSVSVLDSLSEDISKNVSNGKSFIIQGQFVDESFYNCIRNEFLKNESRFQPSAYVSGVVIPVRILGSRLSFNPDFLNSHFINVFIEDFQSEKDAITFIHTLVLKRITEFIGQK